MSFSSSSGFSGAVRGEKHPASGPPLPAGFLAWIDEKTRSQAPGAIQLPMPMPPELQVDDEIEFPRPSDRRR